MSALCGTSAASRLPQRSRPPRRSRPPLAQYFQHTRGTKAGSGYDMWSNETPWEEARGRYSTELFASLAVDTVEQHAPGGEHEGEPLFLALAWQAMHAPLEAPARYVRPFEESIADPQRRTVAGMVSAMDEGVGNLTAALRRAGMLDDTLVVFSTDNVSAKPSPALGAGTPPGTGL